MPDRMQVVHTFAPVFDENSRVLLLGTMPSPRSRQMAFTIPIRKTAFGRDGRIIS